MTPPDFILALFYAVDQEMRDVPKHPEAKLSPSEVVTLALLYAIKGGGTRAFYRWLTRDSLALFPHVPERTRLARLFQLSPTLFQEAGCLERSGGSSCLFHACTNLSRRRPSRNSPRSLAERHETNSQ